MEGLDRARLDAFMAWDSPWPTTDVLRKLADAADHFLMDHNCDVHGWETIATARDAARGRLAFLGAASPLPEDERIPHAGDVGTVLAPGEICSVTDERQVLLRRVNGTEVDVLLAAARQRYWRNIVIAVDYEIKTRRSGDAYITLPNDVRALREEVARYSGLKWGAEQERDAAERRAVVAEAERDVARADLDSAKRLGQAVLCAARSLVALLDEDQLAELESDLKAEVLGWREPLGAADRYSYRVVWSEKDEDFVGTCDEFPSLSWGATSKREALAGVETLVVYVLLDLARSGELPPRPHAASPVSDRLAELMQRLGGLVQDESDLDPDTMSRIFSVDAAPVPDTRTPWGWSDNDSPERWGHADSREEAVACGRDAYDGAPFYVVEGQYLRPESFIPDVDEIVETMQERASGEVGGSVVEDWPHPSAAARDELDAFLNAWAAKNTPVKFWIGVGEPELVDPGGEESL